MPQAVCSPSCPFRLPDSNLNVSRVAQLGLHHFYRLEIKGNFGKMWFSVFIA